MNMELYKLVKLECKVVTLTKLVSQIKLSIEY